MDNNLQKYLFWAFTHIPLINTILQTTLIQIKPSGCTNNSLIKYSQRLNFDVACPMDFKKWVHFPSFCSKQPTQMHPHSSMPTCSRSIPFYSCSRLFGSCFFLFTIFVQPLCHKQVKSKYPFMHNVTHFPEKEPILVLLPLRAFYACIEPFL